MGQDARDWDSNLNGRAVRRLFFRTAHGLLSVAMGLAFAFGLCFEAFAQPQPAPGASEMVPGALQPLLAMDREVAEIAFRLSVANASLCPRNAPQTGMIIHSLDQYGPRLRPIVAASLLLDDRPTIEAVVSGGPADVAGFQAADIISGIDGTPIPGRTSGFGPAPATDRYRTVRMAWVQLRSALQSGRASVRILRHGEPLDLTLVPVTGCDVTVEVLPARRFDASADESRIFVSTAMVEYVASAQELATLIGHEMGHAILRMHRLALGERTHHPSGVGAARRDEMNADQIGLYLAARAGYDINAGPAFWRRYARDHPLQRILETSHPGALARARALESAGDDIVRLERQGSALIPPVLRDFGQ